MRTGGAPTEWKVIPIAPGGEVFKSPDPEELFLGNPSIVTLPGGRIVVSLDMTGPGAKRLQGAKSREPRSGHWLQGKVFVSGDKGETWTCKSDFPFQQAQLFRIGGTLYLMGLAGDFRIMRSVDGGDTWSKPANFMLDDAEYVLSPTNALCARDHVYLAVMKRIPGRDKFSGSFAPVILRARQGVDLTNRKTWSCSEPARPFHEFAPRECLDYFGVASSHVSSADPPEKGGKGGGAGRGAGRLDWDAPHLLEIKEPNHCWHDPAGRTLHLLASTRLHRSNLAAVARVIEDDTGRMVMDAEPTVSGTKTALVSLPGGHLKFDIAYDETSRLYWLAGNPSMDSMTKSDNFSHAVGSPPPRDDRQQLQLYFSRNLADWRFACCMDSGASAKDWRHMCSLAITGSDLYAVCCCGSAKPGARGYTERITFHSISSFRELVY